MRLAPETVSRSQLCFVHPNGNQLFSKQTHAQQQTNPKQLPLHANMPTKHLHPNANSCSMAEPTTGCPYPAVNSNCQVNIVAQAPAVPLLNTDYVADEYATLKQDTQASYKCDHGFEMIGQETSTCLASGKWSSQPPNCVTNIALGRPTNQSSTVKGGDSRNANDGELITQHDSRHCTETRLEQSPWWQIDLLQTYEIRSVRVLGRACCNAQLSLHDLEIRIGNSSTLQGNRLCAWHPEQLEEGVARDFQCAHPTIGRFVSIQMVGIDAALSLCEVMVFSTKEFPSDRCSIQSTLAPTNSNKQQVTTITSVTTTSSSSNNNANNQKSATSDKPLLVFNRTCYEMQTTNGGSFLVADTYCKARGGAVLHSVTNLTQSFITMELDRMKTKLKSKLVWLGAKRENSSPNAPGALLPGGTSALIDGNELSPLSSSMLHMSPRVRSLNTLALDEFSSDNLFSGHGSILMNDESSPIFNPVSLARTNLYQVTPTGNAGAGGSTSRGSQTFGLQISSTPHSVLNRTGGDSISHQRSLIISQPNQLASFFNQPVVGSPSSPSISNSVISSTSTSTSSSSSSHPINQFSAPGSHVHRSLRPPSLVSSMNNANNNQLHNSVSSHLSVSPTQVNWASSASSSNHMSAQNWRWVGDSQSESLMSPITSFMWAEDQPNNYNNQQDCIVLDGGKKWLWNDVTCELDYLPWVCQYRPSQCGSPDRQENSTIIELSSVANANDLDLVFQFGKTITYACPVGHRMEGSRQRKCQYDGNWSGKAPKCQYVDCGPLTSQTIENGRVIYLNQSQTTVGSQIKYVCYEDYVLVGTDMRQCSLDGKWTGKQPYCAYKWCPMLQQIPNGFLNVSSYSENSIASYQCNSGYKLIGNDTRQCLLGGKWTNQEPFCQFVDCGQPKQIPNGQYQLVNKTTNYLSVATYSCNENYTLVANSNNKIICSHTNRWTGKEPQCTLIDCGPPLYNPGTSFMGSQYSIHSQVEYKCDTGFKEVSGSSTRTCEPDGQWTGLPLTCKYVDCGRVPAILKGEVNYTNGTTYLASQVSYECTPGNRLSGHRVRFCGPDGRWTGSSPKCEEIRCDAPDLPANGSAIYIGNDRSFKEQSFSVGVTVQYECDYGHVAKGSWSSRVCQVNGDWSGESPVCQFVDCGAPPTIENGQFVLKMRSPAGALNTISSNTLFESNRRISDSTSSSSSSSISSLSAASSPTSYTYFGTIAHYNCDANYKLVGVAQRECLESGQWRLPMPICEPIQCPKPDFFDEFTQVSLIQRLAASSSSGDIESSSSLAHTAPTNNKNMIKLIANKQWINQQQASELTFGVGDKLHYSCLPGYELYGGPDFRLCTQYGQWSGSSTPRCRQIDCGRPAPIGPEGRFYLLNQTTSFNGLVEYSCVRPFKLIEVKIRQAGNLIETLQQAQAGVTQILTSLPIGVKICANNGQWMPNDQQPKCVSSSSGASDKSADNNIAGAGFDNGTGRAGTGQFDGGDNTLGDGLTGNRNNQHSTSSSNGESSLSAATLPDSSQLDKQHNPSNQTTTSLWAMVVIVLCLMVMFGLILLTLICIRSGKKSSKQANTGSNHQRSMLAGNGSHHPGAMHHHQGSIQLAGTNVASGGPQVNGGAASLVAAAVAHAKGLQNGKQATLTANSLMSHATNQNIYISGAAGSAKMFPGGVMMTPQAAANLQQSAMMAAAANQLQQHSISANGNVFGPAKGALHHGHNQHHGLAYGVGASDHHLAMSQAETIMMNVAGATSANLNSVPGLLNNQSRSLINMGDHHGSKSGELHASDGGAPLTNGAGSIGIGSLAMMDAYSRLNVDHHNHLVNHDGQANTAKTIRHNPNGLVTFISPAQHQQHISSSGAAQNGVISGKIPTSVGSSQAGSTSSNSSGQNHSSPQSISTSLSVSSSSSPTASNSSAHHTLATRLSATTNSPSSISASSSTSDHQHDNNSNTINSNNSSGDYQSPHPAYGQVISTANNLHHAQQPSPPSLPAHPPPSHRLQQHPKQMVIVASTMNKKSGQNQVNQQKQSSVGNNQSSVDILSGSAPTQSNGSHDTKQHQHHYMEPSPI